MSLLRSSCIARPLIHLTYAQSSTLLRRSLATQTLATETSTPPAAAAEIDLTPSGPITRTISLAPKPTRTTAVPPSTPLTSPASSDVLRKSEPYTVTRTPSQGLPVYQYTKSGGNLKMTRVRRLKGEIETLRKQLEGTLRPKPEYVTINSLNGHIQIKVGKILS